MRGHRIGGRHLTKGQLEGQPTRGCLGLLSITITAITAGFTSSSESGALLLTSFTINVGGSLLSNSAHVRRIFETGRQLSKEGRIGTDDGVKGSEPRSLFGRVRSLGGLVSRSKTYRSGILGAEGATEEASKGRKGRKRAAWEAKRSGNRRLGFGTSGASSARPPSTRRSDGTTACKLSRSRQLGSSRPPPSNLLDFSSFANRLPPDFRPPLRIELSVGLHSFVIDRQPRL